MTPELLPVPRTFATNGPHTLIITLIIKIVSITLAAVWTDICNVSGNAAVPSIYKKKIEWF
jgi:hypothetical protein